MLRMFCIPEIFEFISSFPPPNPAISVIYFSVILLFIYACLFPRTEGLIWKQAALLCCFIWVSFNKQTKVSEQFSNCTTGKEVKSLKVTHLHNCVHSTNNGNQLCIVAPLAKAATRRKTLNYIGIDSRVSCVAEEAVNTTGNYINIVTKDSLLKSCKNTVT